MTSHDPLLEWLYALHGPALKWDIETACNLVAELGHPERRFPSLHIAGTNGKGSVAAFVHAIALASGLASGLYTSPHLVRPEERIRLGDADLEPAAFRELIARLRPIAARALDTGRLARHPSFFEIMTAAAFIAFAERGVDLGVIETGLGGRLDATNVIVPRVSVITTIGLDHVKALGGTLASIAREKAGIIKPRVPVLAGWIARRPLDVIADAAGAAGAPLHLAASELRIRRRPGGLADITTPLRTYGSLTVGLGGPHQLRNAALAIRAAELLREQGLALDPEAVASGVRDVRWPGRLERLAPNPADRDAPVFWLDGAHNAEGMRALARALAVRDAAEGRPARRVLLFGVTEGRSPARLVSTLAPYVERVVVTRPEIVKGVDPRVAWTAVSARQAHLEPVLEYDVAAALRRAAQLAGARGEVLVAGSLYLVGDVRRILVGEAGPGHPFHETTIAPAITGGRSR